MHQVAKEAPLKVHLTGNHHVEMLVVPHVGEQHAVTLCACAPVCVTQFPHLAQEGLVDQALGL